MPTIELTDEQAEELRAVLKDHIAETADALAGYEDDKYTVIRHSVSILSDTLHLLEIA